MKNAYLYLINLVFLLFIPCVLNAQLSMTGTILQIDFSGYDGSGFANPPGTGELNAADWLLSETTNLARGLTMGGETGSGIYAYEKQGNTALWLQAAGTYMTPGYKSLYCLKTILQALLATCLLATISWSSMTKNRANSFNFSFSGDNGSFIPQAQLDFTSIEAGRC